MEYFVRAAGPADMRGVFEGRYAVYVDEMEAMAPRFDRQIRDRFDGLSSSLNLVVEHQGRLVGGARWVQDIGQGTTADAYYDFSRHLPHDALLGAGSMLWMLPEARGQRGLIGELMGQGLSWCIDQGISHVLATVNPPVAPRFARVGYRSVGEPFVHGPDALPVQPMILETGVAAQRLAA